VDHRILPFDDAVAIIKRKELISVGACLCRQAAYLGGRPCKHSSETCPQFNSWADYYVDNGHARFINTDEALEMFVNDNLKMTHRDHIKVTHPSLN